ncbi:MAG: hypothetical protein LBC50_02625 [Candidatus Ancillula sp.]|jgi:hypothetical protein|nr:hypothetical protein [Candidatus Ancillula sp.]
MIHLPKNDSIKKYNPTFLAVDFESVISVGNGDFAFNCDATGFQTLFDEYLKHNNPLTTMSNFHWGSYGGNDRYQLGNLTMDEFVRADGKVVRYPQNAVPKRFKAEDYCGATPIKPAEPILKDEASIIHNSERYEWLRKDPHRANMGILQLEVGGRVPSASEIESIHAELNLLSGVFRSRYKIDGIQFEVMVTCQDNTSKAQFKVISTAFHARKAKLKLLRAPASHTIAGADFQNATVSYLDVDAISGGSAGDRLEFEVDFKGGAFSECTFKGENPYVQNFWKNVEVIPLGDVSYSREDLQELERREVLSLYNLAIHSSGSIPPQETGLMCNSWYGKFHLEMHLWHSAWAPLYGVPELIEKSFDWYLEILPQARENAMRNGFSGCRWPKMVGPKGVDSPSIIAPLLCWQQSHIIFLLHLVYGKSLPKKYRVLVKETADFMCDFLVYNAKEDVYDMIGPVIPAQEEFDPMTVLNPTFEMVYWKYCLQLALGMLGENDSSRQDSFALWQEVHEKIAVPKPVSSLFPSHQNAPDTFPNFMKDHPMQLAILGLFESADMQTIENKAALKSTLERVLEDWDEASMWGWDYGYMAMLAHALDDDDLAVQILLKPSPKNYYAANGHNFQLGRSDLPSYLPGNGALLWAIHTIWKGK